VEIDDVAPSDWFDLDEVTFFNWLDHDEVALWLWSTCWLDDDVAWLTRVDIMTFDLISSNDWRPSSEDFECSQNLQNSDDCGSDVNLAFTGSVSW